MYAALARFYRDTTTGCFLLTQFLHLRVTHLVRLLNLLGLHNSELLHLKIYPYTRLFGTVLFQILHLNVLQETLLLRPRTLI